MFLVTILLLGSLMASPFMHMAGSTMTAWPHLMMGDRDMMDMIGDEQGRGLMHEDQDSGGSIISRPTGAEGGASEASDAFLKEQVVPAKGIYLPIAWSDLGVRLINSGVIDPDKFEALYEKRGGLNSYEQDLLKGRITGDLYVDARNAGTILNLLWGLGLANKSEVYAQGPMRAGSKNLANFASTGGWTLAKGDTLSHFNEHDLIKLTPDQEELVADVARNIYRPCCNNAAYFPDCNHGMAMLGLLEVMASQNMSVDEMYSRALAVNSFWYPSTYQNIARYMNKQGQDWSQVDPQKILGRDFSSGFGYRKILSQIEPVKSGGGGGCAV